MKKFILFSLTFLFNCMLIAQNVEFEKSNFPGKELEFKEAKSNLMQGKKYMLLSTGVYQIANNYFLKAQAFNPNNAELNYLIGYCYLNSIQKTKSIEYFERSIALSPNLFPDIKYFLAQGYHLEMKFEKAISLYKEYKSSLSESDLKAQKEVIDKRIEECNNGIILVKNPVNVEIDNLGPIVNSFESEYSPFTNADETVLFFTSRRANTTGGGIDQKDLRYYEDIYYSEKVNGQWSMPKNPSSPLNSNQHDAPVGLSPDGQTLLVYKGSDGGDIYECHLKGTEWTTPKKIKNINTQYHESSGSISFDKKTMYFISDKPGSLGGTDIFVSVKTNKGKWGKPENIGPVINTPYDEEGVLLHPNGHTIYFSSQGHNTMGGFDIFKSTLVDSVWSKPENLGYPINTPDNDIFFSVSASGIHGYYSTSDDDGYGGQDIYMATFLDLVKSTADTTKDKLAENNANIEKPVENKDNQIIVLKGQVIDEKSLTPLATSIIVTDNTTKEIIGTFESNSATGKYLIPLPVGKNYVVTVKADGYAFQSENLDVSQTLAYNEMEKNIMLNKLEVGSTVVLNNIFFDFDKYSLREESYPELDNLVKLLNENPKLKIEISGHTDNKGRTAYNYALSEKRAQTVVNYLVGKGVKKDRLTSIGYGYDKPIASNETIEGRQLNRRTEFKIISK